MKKFCQIEIKTPIQNVTYNKKPAIKTISSTQPYLFQFIHSIRVLSVTFRMSLSKLMCVGERNKTKCEHLSNKCKSNTEKS